ncbi:thrombospondin type 3 repeat-containing protein [Flagellimonas sp. S174]|uniref:thrombospondin type 3 repeat-containing protein n=1 Tax=Flagellimonas sp. S174 TaxID=3410790 RepID=UPI003BF47E5A
MKRLLFILFLLPLTLASQKLVGVNFPEDVIFSGKSGAFRLFVDIPSTDPADGQDYDIDLPVSYTISGPGADNLIETGGSSSFTGTAIIKQHYANVTIPLTFATAPTGDEQIIITINDTSDYDIDPLYPTATGYIHDTEPLRAYPTAFGTAAYITGGRAVGSEVVHVTNTNDSGPGSYRAAFSRNGPVNDPIERYVVFDVAGKCVLESPIIWGGNVSNITVLGQTAPGDGFCVSAEQIVGATMFIDGTSQFNVARNFIFRYLDFIGGQTDSQGNPVAPGSVDVISLFDSHSYIIDHINMYWGNDETISPQAQVGDMLNGRSNITYNFMAFGDPGHSTGSHLGGTGGRYNKINANLLNFTWSKNATNGIDNRFPNTIGDAIYEIIMNIVYDWFWRLNNYTYGGINNVQNNYYKLGHGTRFWLQFYPIEERLNRIQPDIDRLPFVYFEGNEMSNGYITPSTPDQFSLMHQWFRDGTGIYSDRLKNDPYPLDYKLTTAPQLLGAPITIQSAQDAYTDLIVNRNVGNSKGLNSDGSAFYRQHYKHEEWVNGIELDLDIPNPPISERVEITYTYEERPPGYDTDGDGLPNDWEIANGTDPNVMDHDSDIDGNGYPNIEDFANGVDLLTSGPNGSSIPVTGIVWNNDNQTVNVGGFLDLQYTFQPINPSDKTFTLTSSNTSVVNNSGGIVGTGTATLTITTNDGSFTDDMNVTVNAAPVVVQPKRLKSNLIKIIE